MPDRMKISESPSRPTSKVKFCIVDSMDSDPRVMVRRAAWALPARSVRGEGSAYARREHALGEQEMVAPIIAVQMVQSNRAALVGRIHESAVADVDGHVVDAAAVAEEQQITRLQVVACDFRRIQRGDRVRRARQLQAGLAAKNVIDQAAAIETGFRRVAAPAV